MHAYNQVISQSFGLSQLVGMAVVHHVVAVWRKQLKYNNSCCQCLKILLGSKELRNSQCTINLQQQVRCNHMVDRGRNLDPEEILSGPRLISK